MWYLLLVSLTGLLLAAIPWRTSDAPLDYSRDIRPILNKHCLKCHGGVRQQGGLSFLFRAAAVDTTDSGAYAIVPGDPSRSIMLDRIVSDDPDLMMPPEGPRLTVDEVSKLRQWITEGAEWSDHWAYKTIDKEPSLPMPLTANMHNAIDAFVTSRARKQGWKMNKEAAPSTLLRRLSLDITGLPPTTGLIQGYLGAEADMDYNEVVNQLLSSSHYGERWAAMWMDLARYADSQGYQKDKLRPTIWAYRDWVIHAFNQDMPFDQFTIEQLAGDLLPDPTDQQLLATAFHRNTMTNDEGGTDDEEYRVAAIMDRVNTTYEVWQATTMSCVQCHSHPYDPIVHDEYYKVYATFNNTSDTDHPKDLPLATLASIPMQQKQHPLQRTLESMRQSGDTLSDIYLAVLKDYITCLPQAIPIMQELQDHDCRTTQVFERGNWLVHGDEVHPAIPAHLSNITPPSIGNRLDMARWLVDTKNPLTARVLVNRIWEQIFGLGLVESLEDFGTQGTPPSHPDLLDWLAYRLMHTHEWRLKPLIKDIVTSATYRQSSIASNKIWQQDPSNRYLTRGARIRLSAEQLRDQALSVSGLLNKEVYGSSVMPYQPEGVWNTIRNVASWNQSTNGDQHRRALYTFWRRVSPYPSMMTFDTPSREICVSRRIKTNTPLQALVTLNDPVYVEAAQQLTWHALSTDNLEDQIVMAYHKVLFKRPDPLTIDILTDLYNETQDYLNQNSMDTHPCREESIRYESMYNVVSTIMNLDEVIMKG